MLSIEKKKNKRKGSIFKKNKKKKRLIFSMRVFGPFLVDFITKYIRKL